MYNDEFYSKKIKQYGYDVNFKLKNVPECDKERFWIACSNSDDIKGLDLDKTLVTMGIGINNVPHLGTISQILKAIYLQKNGYFVQIVLGDLDVYGARNSSIESIDKLIESYKQFIISLGFDINRGIIRTQRENKDVLLTSYMISSYVDDCDFYELEEEINSLLIEQGKFNGMSFSVKNAYNLVFADFIDPCINSNFDSVIYTCGIDEAQYAWKANQIIKRMGYENKNISSISSKLIRGLNGNPKMGKSLANSSIDVNTSEEDLVKIIKVLLNNGDIKLILDIITSLAIFDTEFLNYLTKLSAEDKLKFEKLVLEDFVEKVNNTLSCWTKRIGGK